MTPKDILKDRYHKKKLAPLYIIRGPVLSDFHENQDLLRDWVKSFCVEIIQSEKSCDTAQAQEVFEMGHSDIIILNKEEEAKEYRQKDQSIVEFTKAHAYPPLVFKQKLIFVNDAQTLSTALANKWLKTLEEPLDNIVTFFVVQGQAPLIQTIESRAITMRLSAPQTNANWEDYQGNFQQYLQDHLSDLSPFKDSELKELKKYIETGHPHHLLEFTKGGQTHRDHLIDFMMDYLAHYSASIRVKDEWLKEIQWFQKARAFNNAPSSRFMGLLQIIEQCS